MRIKNVDELNNSNLGSKVKAQIMKQLKIGNNELEAKSKYKNIKTQRLLEDGSIKKFDSQKEANYFDLLKKKEKAKLISNLSLQPEFDIIPSIKYNDKKLKKIIYKADFSYVENGINYVVDVKGFKTDVYQIKKRLFLLQYPDKVFIEV